MQVNNGEGIHITPVTMVVAGALWLVLFSLGAWNLVETVTNGKANGKAEQRLDSLDERVQDHEARIRTMERKP